MLYTSAPPVSPHGAQSQDVVFSSNSFASFTLVARYGLPPRSGWLSSIRVRCCLRILSRVTPDSLQVTFSQPSPNLGRTCCRIELTTERGQGKPRACSSWARIRPCRKPCPSRPRRREIGAMRQVQLGPARIIVSCLQLMRRSTQAEKRTRKAATAAPVPIARTEAMVEYIRVLLVQGAGKSGSRKKMLDEVGAFFSLQSSPSTKPVMRRRWPVHFVQSSQGGSAFDRNVGCSVSLFFLSLRCWWRSGCTLILSHSSPHHPIDKAGPKNF